MSRLTQEHLREILTVDGYEGIKTFVETGTLRGIIGPERIHKSKVIHDGFVIWLRD